jgi:hypothetical protein
MNERKRQMKLSEKKKKRALKVAADRKKASNEIKLKKHNIDKYNKQVVKFKEEFASKVKIEKLEALKTFKEKYGDHISIDDVDLINVEVPDNVGNQADVDESDNPSKYRLHFGLKRKVYIYGSNDENRRVVKKFFIGYKDSDIYLTVKSLLDNGDVLPTDFISETLVHDNQDYPDSLVFAPVGNIRYLTEQESINWMVFSKDSLPIEGKIQERIGEELPEQEEFEQDIVDPTVFDQMMNVPLIDEKEIFNAVSNAAKRI